MRYYDVVLFLIGGSFVVGLFWNWGHLQSQRGDTWQNYRSQTPLSSIQQEDGITRRGSAVAHNMTRGGGWGVGGDCVGPGVTYAPRGGTSVKLRLLPQKAPTRLMVPPAMGRRIRILLRFIVVVGLGESYQGSYMDPEGVPW